jgi:hypothetical protein
MDVFKKKKEFFIPVNLQHLITHLEPSFTRNPIKSKLNSGSLKEQRKENFQSFERFSS